MRVDADTLQFMSSAVGSEDLGTKTAAVAATVSEKPGVHPALGIAGILNSHFGRDWWEWEPETVDSAIRELRMPHSQQDHNTLTDMIGSLQVCFKTNQPFENWHIFEKVGHAFNGNLVDFSVLQPLRTDEAAGTIQALRTLRPKEPFDSEVVQYVACCAKHDGLVYLPDAWFGAEFQAALDALGNDENLKARAVATWKAHDRNQCQNDAERVQYDSLTEIEDYLRNRGA